MAHPRHFLMRLLEEIIRNNSTILLQAGSEELLYMLDNFVDNAGLLDQYLSASDEIAREISILKLC